jgi:hypothetical protein
LAVLRQAVDFHHAYSGGAVGDLSVEIRNLNYIPVHDSERPNAGSGEIRSSGTSQPTSAYN